MSLLGTRSRHAAASSHPLVTAGMCGCRAEKALNPGNKWGNPGYPHVLTHNGTALGDGEGQEGQPSGAPIPERQTRFLCTAPIWLCLRAQGTHLTEPGFPHHTWGWSLFPLESVVMRIKYW